MVELSLLEYEILNNEYIRCLKLIKIYSKIGQKCLLFKLKSFECLISKTIYENVITKLKEKLICEGYDVYICKTELLIFWDKKKNNVSSVEIIEDKPTNNKKKNNKEEININHIKFFLGDYQDNFPIKTGKY